MSLRRLLLTFLLCFIAASAFASNASPIAISGISIAGNTLTVTTSAAHGLSATLPSGFCISGSSAGADNVCGVVLSTPLTTSFTFTLSGGAACSSSCGTVLPAKRVIWLTTQTVSGGYQVNYLLWVVTPSGVPGKGSAWSGASASENAALNSGTFIEVPRSQFFPLGTSLANAEAQLQNDWIAQQNALTASVQPGQFFGNFLDSAGWTQ